MSTPEISETGAIPAVPDSIQVRTADLHPETYKAVTRMLAGLGLDFTESFDGTLPDVSPGSIPRTFAGQPAIEAFAGERFYPSDVSHRMWTALGHVGTTYASPQEASRAPYQPFDIRAGNAVEQMGRLVRFVDSAWPGAEGQGRLLDLTGADVLLRSLLADGYKRRGSAPIRSFGSRGRSFLADFINHRLQLDPPLPLAYEPDGSTFDPVKAPLPHPETFVPDDTSPYLERITVRVPDASPHGERTTSSKQHVALVIGEMLYDYGYSIGVPMTHMQTMRSELLSQMVTVLHIDIKNQPESSQPQWVHPGVYLLPGDRRDSHSRWGIAPERFLEMVHGLESDEARRQETPAYTPSLRPFIRRYLNAIAQPPQDKPAPAVRSRIG